MIGGGEASIFNLIKARPKLGVQALTISAGLLMIMMIGYCSYVNAEIPCVIICNTVETLMHRKVAISLQQENLKLLFKI